MSDYSFSTSVKLPIRFVLAPVRDFLTIEIYCDKLEGKPSEIPFARWRSDKGLLRVKFTPFDTFEDLGIVPRLARFCEKIFVAWEAGK